MKESVTYQAIVEEGIEKGRLEGRREGQLEGRREGRLEQARQMILNVGAEHLGEPSEEVHAAIHRISDVDRLHRLGRRLLYVSTWEDLLASP